MTANMPTMSIQDVNGRILMDDIDGSPMNGDHATRITSGKGKCELCEECATGSSNENIIHNHSNFVNCQSANTVVPFESSSKEITKYPVTKCQSNCTDIPCESPIDEIADGPLVDRLVGNNSAIIPSRCCSDGAEVMNKLPDSTGKSSNFEACAADKSAVSVGNSSCEMEGSNTSSFDIRVQQYLDKYNNVKADSTFKEGKAYGDSCFTIRRLDETGGVLQVQSDSEKQVVMLRIPAGALSRPLDIYVAVDWYGSGFSPTVRCGPPGTRFNQKVYLYMPIYGKWEELKFRKREQNASGWTDPDPDSCPYMITKDECVVGIDSFSDHQFGLYTCKFNLQVYIQQTSCGLVCIRYYLVQATSVELQKRVIDGEKCFRGDCVENSTLMVTKGGDEIKITLNSEELESLEQHPTRTTTEEWISSRNEMASSFMTRQMEGQDCAHGCLEFEVPGIPKKKKVPTATLR